MSMLEGSHQNPKSYWVGNSAKYRIIKALIHDCSGTQVPMRVLDFGAGDGGDWAKVVRDHPQIELTCFEPNPESNKKLSNLLQGTSARVINFEQLRAHEPQHFDRIISFSVFEHVLDRKDYLHTAHRLLAPHGIFYLNYDDGHFRNRLDVGVPRTWKTAVGTYVTNHLSSFKMKHGLSDKAMFYERVAEKDVNQLIEKLGFETKETWYENLEAFKLLAKSIKDSQAKVEFMDFWLEVEKTLNTRFARPLPSPHLGDSSNLWQVAASKTLALVRRK